MTRPKTTWFCSRDAKGDLLMFVKPAEGVKVRDPVTLHHIPADGTEVPADTYWLRRVAAGDVVVADPKSKPAAAPSAPRTAKEGK